MGVYLRIIFVIAALPLAVHAATSVPKMNIAVKFDKSFYELNYDGRFLIYHEDARTYKIDLKSCNRTKLTRFTDRYQSLLKKYNGQAAGVKSNYDVELTTDGKKLNVARGSAFGTWLRDLPKKMMYVNAEAQVSCKR